mgnify:CR=1 FL=1
MLQKYAPKKGRTQQRGVVNLKEHLSTLSPSEIIDEMETVFFDDLHDDDLDPDTLDLYLDALDRISPINVPNTGTFEDLLARYKPIVDANSESNSKPLRKPPHRCYRWILTAALVCILICAGTAVYANNSNAPFARWVKSTFTFYPREESTYASLQDALDFYHIDNNLVPTQLPAGFSVTDVSVHSANSFTMFSSQYKNMNGDTFSITIKQLHGQGASVYEKGSDIQVVSQGGVNYYIMHNFDCITIVWCIDQFECCISGNIPEEDVLPIINSIE